MMRKDPGQCEHSAKHRDNDRIERASEPLKSPKPDTQRAFNVGTRFGFPKCDAPHLLVIGPLTKEIVINAAYGNNRTTRHV